MRKSLSFLVILTLATLVPAPLSAAGPSSNRGTAKDRRELRRDVNRWLRARQRVLLKCEGCAGKGVRYIPRVVTGKGLTTIKKRHKSCYGTGLVVNRFALRDLYAPYLDDAQVLVGLGEERMTELDIRELLDDDELQPKEKRRKLIRDLGLIRRSAQVKRMKFEDRTDGVLVATVTATAAPVETRWVKIEKRWRLVDAQDLDKAVNLALGQTDQGPDNGDGNGDGDS